MGHAGKIFSCLHALFAEEKLRLCAKGAHLNQRLRVLHRRVERECAWKHSARLSRRPPPRASDCRPEARIPPAAAARQIRPLPRLLFLILHEGARERARTGEARLFFCGNRRVSLQKRPSLAKIIPYMKRRRCI